MKNKSRFILPTSIALLSFNLVSCQSGGGGRFARHTSKYSPGMVVTAQHEASKVGYQVLAEGGNAIDATVAMGYALAVAHPSCGNLAGGGFMLLHRANGSNVFVDFREEAPAKIRQVNLSKANEAANPGVGVAIPGTVAGLEAMRTRYGTMSRQALIAPSIRLAENGFKIVRGDMPFIHEGKKYFTRYPKEARIFMRGNDVIQPRQRLVQTDLARSLRLISAEGAPAIYQGTLAQKMVRMARSNGGVLTMNDLKHYRERYRKPISCHYKGYQIVTAPLPSAGGATLCQILNDLKPYPMQQIGFRTPKALRVNLAAMYYSFRDSDKVAGDPDFSKTSVRPLLTKAHADKVHRLIAKDLTRSAQYPQYAALDEGLHTTSVVAADRWGNVVSMTYTLNDFFGQGLMPDGTGFFLNNENKDFSSNPKSYNAPAPYKRPVSYIAPTLVFHDGQWVMTMGTPGGRTISTQLSEFLENYVDYKMPYQQAINTPRYHYQTGKRTVNVEKNAISSQNIQLLRRLGYHIKRLSPFGYNQWGGVTLIARKPATGELYGVMDKRRPAGEVIG